MLFEDSNSHFRIIVGLNNYFQIFHYKKPHQQRFCFALFCFVLPTFVIKKAYEGLCIHFFNKFRLEHHRALAVYFAIDIVITID